MIFSTKVDNTIETRVMSTVKQRIADAQTNYNQESSSIDIACDVDIDAIERRRVEQKSALADELVTRILG